MWENSKFPKNSAENKHFSCSVFLQKYVSCYRVFGFPLKKHHITRQKLRKRKFSNVIICYRRGIRKGVSLYLIWQREIAQRVKKI